MIPEMSREELADKLSYISGGVGWEYDPNSVGSQILADFDALIAEVRRLRAASSQSPGVTVTRELLERAFAVIREVAINAQDKDDIKLAADLRAALATVNHDKEPCK